MRALNRLLFWEYPRESWQWWIIVVLILTFVFATPPEVFKDKPRAASITMLTEDQYQLDAKSLDGYSEAEWPVRATALVNKKFKGHVTIARVEPVLDDEEVTGYMAFTKP